MSKYLLTRAGINVCIVQVEQRTGPASYSYNEVVDHYRFPTYETHQNYNIGFTGKCIEKNALLITSHGYNICILVMKYSLER